MYIDPSPHHQSNKYHRRAHQENALTSANDAQRAKFQHMAPATRVSNTNANDDDGYRQKRRHHTTGKLTGLATHVNQSKFPLSPLRSAPGPVNQPPTYLATSLSRALNLPPPPLPTSHLLHKKTTKHSTLRPSIPYITTTTTTTSSAFLLPTSERNTMHSKNPTIFLF